jgi:hypothetical protein
LWFGHVDVLNGKLKAKKKLQFGAFFIS